ncbi:MAG: DJ-1/PfpI family protein [Myxococcales bacterium]|nr:MAG: DJ-1/PfpI family protein [Myxococcales bacterium]
MSNACLLLAEGFEEIEAITVLDVLRRANIDIAAVGVDSESVLGAHGIKVQTDLTMPQAVDRNWDVVILPGGLPGAQKLTQSKEVQKLIKKQHQQSKNIAAICAAPMALAKAGVLTGKQATCYPGFESYLKEGNATFHKQDVVVDGTITTSRGPGTALAFALELVAQLKGKNIADELAKATLST